MITKIDAKHSLQDFEDFIIGQPDLLDRLNGFSVANPLVREAVKFERFGTDLVRAIMVMGIWLYREWLIAHGDEQIKEVETKLKPKNIKG